MGPSIRFRVLPGASVLALVWAAMAFPALAQDAEPAAVPQEAVDAALQEDPAVDEAPAEQGADIVVTGTRLGGNFTSPTPVTVLNNERLDSLSITNVGEALSQLPSFRASTGPAQQANQGGSVGARLLDLRGLDPQRTLVLVDGRRFVPSTAQGTVDVNLIPSAIVRRTDVVTGGASAAYGSDAVAGVVNFVLDRDFKGVRGEVVGGISERGDDGSVYAGLTTGFAVGSRINIVLAGEYERGDGLGDCYTREWCANQTLILGNTPAGAGGLPANLIVPGVNTSTLSPGGLINRSYNAAGQVIGTMATDPLRGTKFLPDGTPAPFEYGSMVGPLFMLGGEGQGRNSFISPFLLKVPVERVSTFATIGVDLAEGLKANVDLSYGRVQGTVVSNVMRDFNATLMGRINRDNPFIPASVAADMDANGVASFILGRAGYDLGPAYAESETSTYRAALNLAWEVSDAWTVEAFYQYGKTEFRQRTFNAINLDTLPRAIDAVRNGAGQIVCRVNADASTTNDDPACVAFNPFGEGRYDPAAAAYVTGNGFQNTDNDQHALALDVRGTLLNLPAGPLTAAVGAEYRRDEIVGTTDPVSLANRFWTLNGSALAGKVEVKEAYAEVAAPILRDSSLGHLLDLNGAVRRTDYSTTGAVTTWKVGAVYEPVAGFRLRGTRSRDIRAPNLSELAGPRTRRTIGLTDPENGLQTNPNVITGSNPNLSVEKADSWTVGAVLTPRGGGILGRARLSVDYYDIKVANAIGTLGAQTLANRCFEGVTEFCSLITRDPATNTILQIEDVFLNSNELRTNGIDVEFQYRQPLGSLGSLNATVLANITNELTIVDSAGAVDRAGQTGHRTGTIAGVPDYVIDGILTWATDGFELTGRGRYIPAGVYWTNFVGPDQEGYSITSPNSVDNNRVPSRFYLDLTARVMVPVADGRSFEFFGTVNNLLDRDPPSIPGPSGGTNQILFDAVGRAFRLGARVKFGG
jgi:outer membrane receptor protein involved in Fe transport